MFDFCGAGDRIQGFANSGTALYQLSHIPRLYGYISILYDSVAFPYMYVCISIIVIPRPSRLTPASFHLLLPDKSPFYLLSPLFW